MGTIDNVLKREGPPSDDPVDRGGRTAFGISEKSNPEAWRDGKVTEAEAREIYERKYVKGPGFDRIQDSNLRNQLIDFGVNSGPTIAIQKLQSIVGVGQDGKLGPETLEALSTFEPNVVNNSLVIERVRMIGRIVTKNPSQLKFLNGWLLRATDFIR